MGESCRSAADAAGTTVSASICLGVRALVCRKAKPERINKGVVLVLDLALENKLQKLNHRSKGTRPNGMRSKTSTKLRP